MKAKRAVHHENLDRLIVDELIDILDQKKVSCREMQDDIALLEGLEELLSHASKGLREVKSKRLPPTEEAHACRCYLKNLLGTLEHMSHTSRMAEMAAQQSALREILKDLLICVEKRRIS